MHAILLHSELIRAGWRAAPQDGAGIVMFYHEWAPERVIRVDSNNNRMQVTLGSMVWRDFDYTKAMRSTILNAISIFDKTL